MSSKDPLVTVVVVAYNHGKFLRETMESIFAQTMPDFEVILLNNGSLDESAQVISELKDDRLTCITQENVGPSLACNIGIKRARGKWIALGSGDDLWKKEKLARQLQVLQERGAQVSLTAAQLIDDSGLPVPDEATKQFPFSFDDLPRAQMYEKLFFESCFVCAASALIDRSLLPDPPFDSCCLQLQDYDLWVRLIKKGEIVTLQEKLVGYRVRLDGQNLSLQNRARVLFELHRVYRSFFDDVDPELFKAAFGKHFRKPEPQGSLGLEFEKAFLYLKMKEPCIRVLGLELLYLLMAADEGRALALSDYGLKINDLWQLARTPVYADSLSMEEAVLSADELNGRLKEAEAELAALRQTMRQITSGKLWKLREKMHTILRPFAKS